MSGPGLRLEAYASGYGTIYLAAGDQHITVRDLHVHHGDGVHRVRRIESHPESGDDCPYPGMTAFGAEQSKWFFGRDRALAKLTGRLDECLRDGGAVAVVAASGTGKSSLLQAGLVPALARGTLPGSRRWPCLLFTPGAHPVAALTRHLAALTDSEPDDVEGELDGDPRALADRLGGALRSRGADRLMVIVDQAEELFTQTASEDERRRFITALARLTDSPGPSTGGPPALVVYGVRADFYARFAQYRPVHEALERRQVFIGPMSETELREAILFPAQRERLEFEEGLVELLLSDLGVAAGGLHRPEEDGSAEPSAPGRGYEAGRLPLLAHALRTTWQQRHGSTLTVDGYKASGRIQGAVSDTAETIYRGLDTAGREAAEVLFRRLVRIGEGSEDTRRAVTEERLTEGLVPAAAEAVLAGFTGRRLLTRSRDTVQITHEALLHAWPRLRAWVDTDRADNLLRQQLEEAAAAWARTPRRDPALLYRGSRLEAARAWAARTGRAGLGATASAFLDASIRLRRRTTLTRRTAVALLIALSLIAMTAAESARDQKKVADQQRRTAVEQGNLAMERLLQARAENLRGTDPQLSLQLSLAALRLHPTQEARTGLITTLQQTRLDGGSQPGAVGSLMDTAAFSRDGGMLAVGRAKGQEKGTVRLWDTTDAGYPSLLATLTGHANEAQAVAFSPDLRRLVTVAAPTPDGAAAGEKPADSDVILWDLTDRHHPRRMAFDAEVGDRVQAAVFSPDSRRLALLAGGSTGTLTLWDVGDGAAPRRLAGPVAATQAQYAAFSADGRLLVTGSGTFEAKDESGTPGSVTHGTGWQVWDVTDPTAPRATAEERLINGPVVLSPTAPVLATGWRRTVLLWDLTDPGSPRKLAALNNSDDVSAFAFGPDGRSLITSSSDGGSVLWDLTDPAHPRPQPPLVGSHGAVAASRNELDQQTRAGSFRRIESVAFSGDGQRVLQVDGGGTVSQWLVGGRPAPAVIAPVPGTDLRSAAFSPNGRRLVVGGRSGDAHLWDTSDPARPQELAVLPGRAGWQAVAVGFNRDSTVVAVGTRYGVSSGQGGEVTLWDVSDQGHPRRLTTLAVPSGVGSLAFSPRSGVLAVTGGKDWADSWVGLWDTDDPSAPVQLKLIERLSPLVNSLTAPTGSGGGPLVTLPDPLPSIQHTPTVFSPDGRRLILPGSLWDVSDPAAPVLVPVAKPADPLAGLLAGITRPLSGTSAAAFGPDGTVLADDGLDGVRLWQSGQSIGPAPLATIPVTAELVQVAYHPDGGLIALGQRNGVVRLYETADPTVPGWAADLPDSATDLADVRFSPNRRSLFVVRDDGSGQLWDLGALPAITADPVGLACRIAGGGLSRGDWELTYAKGLPYQDTCARS
ncbi:MULTISPECIES: hypothetical protein [unclassified Kitasatospora]|uniref:nSTAND1 domain-containing NTPase n=1 Tax=unclassified Kitasatospora TaxID=2633591 RepID=UPI00381D6B05